MSVRVFILDDHAVFRSGLKALLERERDFQIVGETGSGVDALNALDEHPVDVLLLDISIPTCPARAWPKPPCASFRSWALSS